MTGIVEFIEARITEDEAWAADVSQEWANPYTTAATPWTAERVLAECAAKRALMDDLFAYEAKIDGEWGCCHDPAEIRADGCRGITPEQIEGLRILAAIWSGHESFDPAWVGVQT